MKKYTIGALFTPDFQQVLLIKKNRPEWQKGNYNLPGGHIEEGEVGLECIAREFEEEAGVKIRPLDWFYIDLIENEGEYTVEFFTAIYDATMHGTVDFNASDEQIRWCNCQVLPVNTISNLTWLVPFALDFHEQGNHDNLAFGHFSYAF